MALPADIVAAVAARLAAHAGLELPAWVVETRAAARMAALALPPAAYAALIESPRGAAELDELVEAVRVGESRLFRHRSQIAALVDAVVPALRATGRRAVRAWSAGCAAGQEPYTLAVVLARALPGWSISIAATDVSEDALAAAQRASYPAAALADVPEAWRDGFEPDPADVERVRVRPEYAALVRFERANLVDGPAPRGCDLVWCRNVLIYFTAAARQRALQRLVGALAPGGALFVGYSESLRDVPGLEAVRAGDAVFYTSAAGGAAAPASPRARRPDTGPRAAALPAPAAGSAIPAVPAVAAVSAVPAGSAIPAASAIPAVPAVPALPAVPAEPTPRSLAAIPLAAPAPHLGAAPLAPDPDHTPPPTRFPADPPAEDVLALRGRPEARAVVAAVSARLGLAGLARLVIDLDGCELLDDELAPVLRRARAAGEAAGIAVALRATRGGARRWLARHGLEAP